MPLTLEERKYFRKEMIKTFPLSYQPTVYLNDEPLFPIVANMYTLEKAYFKFDYMTKVEGL
ncbi:MAG: hypothetical protein ACTSW1_08345 [Candidatus Hodarchaeales archaeon]